MQPLSGLDLRREGRPLFDGRLALTRLADRRTLPFHVDRMEPGEDYFDQPELEALRRALAQTLRQGDACRAVELVHVDPVLEPLPERLARLGEMYPMVDFLLTGAVEALNVTNQLVGTVDVRVGNVDYRNLPYYAHRLRIRVHLEVYSLRDNQLVWGDVLEGLGHAEYHRDDLQGLLDGAFRRLCQSIQASMTLSATQVVPAADGQREMDVPTRDALARAAVEGQRLRKLGLAEDYDRVHQEGQAFCRAQAESMWRDAVANVERRKAAAALLNAFADYLEQEQGAAPGTIQRFDLSRFDRELAALGAESGSELISLDVKTLIDRLVGVPPPPPQATGREVTVLGARFREFKARHLDLLSQVSPQQTGLLASAADRVFEAYLDAYGARNDLRRKLALPENRPTLFLFRKREGFRDWVAGFGGAKDSGGFQWYVPDGHAIRGGLEAAGYVGRPSVIAMFWYGYNDTEGNPLNAIEAMWCTVPHELGHHVHAQLLSFNEPDFQKDGFTTVHEYPVDFAGRIRFGQFENPGNAWRLRSLKGAGAIPLDRLVTQPYQQISQGGTNQIGYVSVWVYYLYLRSERPQQLLDYERRLAALPHDAASAADQARLFREAFGLADHAAVLALGEEAVRWARAKEITEEQLRRAREAYLAVSGMEPRVYNYRLRVPAEAPE